MFKLIRCAQEIVKYGQLVAKLSREIAAKVRNHILAFFGTLKKIT